MINMINNKASKEFEVQTCRKIVVFINNINNNNFNQTIYL